MPARAAVPSFRNNFAARFAADLYGLATSLAAAAITARVLGPSGRGYYSSLVLVSVLFIQLFNGGLGEASVVLPKRDKVDERRAISATVAAVGPLAVLGAFATVAFGALALTPATSNERLALALAGLLVLLNTLSTTMSWILVAKERLVAVAAVTIVSGTVTTIGIYVLLAVVDLETAGAILAAIFGCVTTFLPMRHFLQQEGVSLRPRWNGPYLRSAARFGMAVQMSNLLVQMTGRLDLLFVFRIAGAAPAGGYSVALTIGALVGSVPIAIAFASFPRLSNLAEADARALTPRIFRSGVAAAGACAAALAVVTPVALPVVFGPAYDAAIIPTLVLIPGGVLWSAQWILSRASAARGDAKPLFVSFAASFVVMVMLDLLLIKPFALIGAALASLTSSLIGLLVAGAYYRSKGWGWREFVPRGDDVLSMANQLRQMLRALRGRAPSRGA